MNHLIKQLFIFIEHAQKPYKMLSERKKERLKEGHKTGASMKPKDPTRRSVVSLTGKCIVLYVVKNANIKKLIEYVKHVNRCVTIEVMLKHLL